MDSTFSVELYYGAPIPPFIVGLMEDAFEGFESDEAATFFPIMSDTGSTFFAEFVGLGDGEADPIGTDVGMTVMFLDDVEGGRWHVRGGRWHVRDDR